MTGRHASLDYTLIVADWHQYSRPLWERVLTFFKSLTDHVGISQMRMDTQLVLGTYRIAPFGVRIAPRSAFLFPVLGNKKIRFLPGSFAERTPALQRADDYALYLGDSLVVTAGPGEAIYWPSKCGHVGESDGDFSVSWEIGYWIGDGLRKLALEVFLETLAVLRPATPGATVLDVEIARTLSAVDAIMDDMLHAASSDVIRQSFISRQIAHDSAYGFLKLPPLVAATKEWQTIQIKSVFRVLTAQVSPSELCVALAGRSRIIRSSPAVLQAIDTLNRGCAVEFHTLVGFGGDDEAAAIADLIDLCSCSGAVCFDGAS